MKKLLVATSNKGKLSEIRTLLQGSDFDVVGLADVGITKDVEEPGTTFEANAVIKAMTYGKWSGLLTLSEDSGLCIDALNGRPGVYTKQYYENTPDNGHAKFLDEMKDVPESKRSAQFHSVMAIYDPSTDKVRLCEGIARGQIALSVRGTNGMGQDPIFIYEGGDKTGGEMTAEEKNKVSHRSRSLAKAKEILIKEFV